MRYTQKISLVIVCVLMLALFVSLSFYSYPFADDFTYALKGLEPNLLSTVLNEREIWNGRYLSNFLVIFHPLTWGGLYAYRACALAILLLSFVTYYFCVKQFFKQSTLLVSTVLFVLFLSIVPDLGEAFFWYTGAVTYMPASALILVSFATILKSNFTIKTSVFLAVLFAIGSGFNEIFALLNIGLLLLNYKHGKSWWLLVVWQVALFVYVYTAPGNDVRGALFSENHQVYHSVKYTIAYAVRFVGEWLLNPAFYAAAYLVLKFGGKVVLPQSLNKPKNIVFLLFAPITVACFGPIWSTGLLGQYRTANFASYLFVPSFFVLIFYLRKYVQHWRFKNTGVAFVVLLVGLLTWKNSSIVLFELLTGKLSNQKMTLQKRVELLSSCQLDTCYVPMINEPSRLLIVYPLTPNANHWKNKSYQLYYKSGKVLPE